jgi:hypothetical protein
MKFIDCIKRTRIAMIVYVVFIYCMQMTSYLMTKSSMERITLQCNAIYSVPS